MTTTTKELLELSQLLQLVPKEKETENSPLDAGMLTVFLLGTMTIGATGNVVK